MARLIEDTRRKIRDLPIAARLREILVAAATAGVHVGFGSDAVWGAADKSANAPDRLRAAAARAGARP